MGVFGDLNEVKLIGNITQDIEVKKTPNGNSVTNFGLATNRSYKMGDEWKEETAFHNIVVWGNDSDYLGQRAKKGTRIFVSGRLQTRSWDGNDGEKKYRTEIVADKVILLDRYERGQGEGSSNQTSSVSKQKESHSQSNEDAIDPNDLPF